MTNQGSEPLRCVALVDYDPTELGAGILTRECGGPVIETEGPCAFVEEWTDQLGPHHFTCLEEAEGHEWFSVEHGYVAPLVHADGSELHAVEVER